ncbi:MAG TPA: ABC transporter ATP-binding protein, partial [Thermoanaerobaculia bacterium]
ALFAESGAGKTTLLRIIAGLETSYAGEVLLDGEPVTEPSPAIQLVFQDNRLLPWQTVIGNMTFASGEDDLARAEDLLTDFGLSKVLHQWPKDLSGGQVARAAFARLFLRPAKVILLDEPFSNLDIPNAIRAQATLLSHVERHSITALMATHDVDDAVALADRILLLGSNPLRIVDTITIDLRRPRLRDDPAVSAVVGDVRRRIISSLAAPEVAAREPASC